MTIPIRGISLTHAQELAKYGKIVFVGNFNIQLSEGKGIAIEYGEVSTDKGWTQAYKTYYHTTVGFPSGTGNVEFVISKNATFSDWGGSYYGVSGGWEYASINLGASSTYGVIGLGIGPSFAPSVKGYEGTSGNFQKGETILIGSPYYNPYPNGSGPYSNAYNSELYGN